MKNKIEEFKYYAECFNMASFEKSCRHFAEEEKSMRKQSSFFKRCRQYLLGQADKRQWSPLEREMKLDMLEKYFPGTKQAMLDYEKQELESLASRERIRQDRDKQKLLNERGKGF